MTDPVASSQLCGSCHNVKVDLNGNGLVAEEFRLSAQSQLADSDEDGILDSNESMSSTGSFRTSSCRPPSTSGRTTSRSQQAQGGRGLACIECHMPALQNGPIVDKPALLSGSADRARRAHSFIGVDYDLNAGVLRSRRGCPRTL